MPDTAGLVARFVGSPESVMRRGGVSGVTSEAELADVDLLAPPLGSPLMSLRSTA